MNRNGNSTRKHSRGSSPETRTSKSLLRTSRNLEGETKTYIGGDYDPSRSSLLDSSASLSSDHHHHRSQRSVNFNLDPPAYSSIEAKDYSNNYYAGKRNGRREAEDLPSSSLIELPRLEYPPGPDSARRIDEDSSYPDKLRNTATSSFSYSSPIEDIRSRFSYVPGNAIPIPMPMPIGMTIVSEMSAPYPAEGSRSMPLPESVVIPRSELDSNRIVPIGFSTEVIGEPNISGSSHDTRYVAVSSPNRRERSTKTSFSAYTPLPTTSENHPTLNNVNFRSRRFNDSGPTSVKVFLAIGCVVLLIVAFALILKLAVSLHGS